jgi:hypothetical protein
MRKNYKSFSEFYTFYLTEHNNQINRRLHFVGIFMVILTIIYVIAAQNWIFLILAPVFGYGFAWIGHFKVEKNKPATFDNPFYSLAGDFVMFKDILIGRIKL